MSAYQEPSTRGITRNSSSVRIKNFSFENEDRLVGDIVTAIVTVFAAMLIIAAIVAR